MPSLRVPAPGCIALGVLISLATFTAGAQDPTPTPTPPPAPVPAPVPVPSRDSATTARHDSTTATDPAPKPEPAAPPTKLEPPKPAVKSPWSGTARANGSAFFGTSDQRVVGARATIARTDSSVQLGASGEIVYGDSKLEKTSRSVSKRTLLGTMSVEYRPHGLLSPFVLVTLESSLEKKIDGRYSISVGARQTLHRTELSEASISAALLDELTVPFEIAEPLPSTRLTRWSFRGRVRHEFDDRLRASHTTFWMPSARTAARYLVRSTSEAQYALTRVVNFTTSLNVNYDSEAMARGARVNHDGQLLFGIGARW